jgi:hypothetical protein
VRNGSISVQNTSHAQEKLLEKVRAFVEDDRLHLLLKLRENVFNNTTMFCAIPDPSPNMIISSSCKIGSNVMRFDLYFDSPRHLQNNAVEFVFLSRDHDVIQFQKTHVQLEYVDGLLERILLYFRLRFNLI